MKNAFLILLFVSHCCFSQPDYDITLSRRIAQIKNLEYYDNNVVLFSGYPESRFGFPHWTNDQVFYMNDITQMKGVLYEALADSIVGKSPETSPDAWRIFPPNHPYQFLSDSAKKADLRRLVKDDNPFIRAYSFAALAHRSASNLFHLVLSNLGDSTRIDVITYDVGKTEYVPKLMISYIYRTLTSNKQEKLNRLIAEKYPYLDISDRKRKN